jgi:glycosyltransferase involved in cell wall biosynthesis
MYPNTEFPISGIFVHEQVKILKEMGHEVIVVAPKPLVPKFLQFVKKKWCKYYNISEKETIDKVNIHHPSAFTLPAGLLMHLSGHFYYFAIKKLIKHVYKYFKFDIIHAHTLLPDGYAATLLKKSFKVPIIVTVHGTDMQNTIHKNKSCQKAILKAIEKSDKVVFVSNKLKKIAHNFYRDKPDSKFAVINNGVSLTKLENIDNIQLKQKYKGKTVLLSVGNLKDIKGHQFVIQILPDLLKIYPDIYYLIVGDGEERQNLENQIRNLKLDNFVQFVGSVKHNQVLEYMNITDIFVLPSYNEGFGAVYIEAMSLARPTVGCKTQGIEDCITHMKNGFLVEPKNPDDLLNCIRYILDNPEKVKEIALAGQKHVLGKFTWDHNVNQYVSLYNQLTRHKNHLDNDIS